MARGFAEHWIVTSLTFIQKSMEKFVFEKNVNASSMSLSGEKMTKMMSLCLKYEIKFPQKSNDLGFRDRIYHKLMFKRTICHTDVHMAA